jgi:hypothetical protein
MHCYFRFSLRHSFCVTTIQSQMNFHVRAVLGTCPSQNFEFLQLSLSSLDAMFVVKLLYV